MEYLITKQDLQTSLIDKLTEDIQGKDYSFFTDQMNRTFIEQTHVIKNEYFFDLINELCVFDEVYLLEEDGVYEKAYNAIFTFIEKDFKNKGGDL